MVYDFPNGLDKSVTPHDNLLKVLARETRSGVIVTPPVTPPNVIHDTVTIIKLVPYAVHDTVKVDNSTYISIDTLWIRKRK